MNKIIILLSAVMVLFASCDDEDIQQPKDQTTLNQINLNNDNLIGHNTPVVDNQDNLFVIMSNELGSGDPECFVYAFNKNKEELWHVGLSPKATQLVALPNGNIIAKGSSAIYCLNKSTGAELWNIDLKADALIPKVSEIAIDKSGNIFFVKDGYYNANFEEFPAVLVSLSESGSENWSQIVESTEYGCHYGSSSNLLIADGKIYFGFRSSLDDIDTKYLMVFSTTGAELGRIKTADDYGPITPKGIDLQNNIYATRIAENSNKSELLQFNQQGNLEWTCSFTDKLNSQLVIDASNNIYLGCDDGYLNCINKNGQKTWSTDFGIFCRGSFLIGDNNKLYHFQQNVSEINTIDGSITTIGNSFDITGGDLAMLSDGTLVLPGGIGIIWFYSSNASGLQKTAPWYKKYGNSSNTCSK